MDSQMKSRLTSKDVWLRGLYMIFFAIAWGLSEVLLAFSVIFQFIAVLITGSANLPLLRFGQNLSRYHYQIAQFVTFNTEDRPFPFSDWPDDAPGGEHWQDAGEPPAAEDAEVTAEAAEEAPEEASEEASNATPAPEAQSDAEEVSESRKDEAPPPA